MTLTSTQSRWMTAARCAGLIRSHALAPDGQPWLAADWTGTDGARNALACAACVPCRVRHDCLVAALHAEHPDATWTVRGGYSAMDRAAMNRHGQVKGRARRPPTITDAWH